MAYKTYLFNYKGNGREALLPDVPGWYAIPIPVGGGKTQTILHFIKFLCEHDEDRTFPISVAFEKISEIEHAATWLKEKGVPDEFYQIDHHKVPNSRNIYKTLPNYPLFPEDIMLIPLFKRKYRGRFINSLLNLIS